MGGKTPKHLPDGVRRGAARAAPGRPAVVAVLAAMTLAACASGGGSPPAASRAGGVAGPVPVETARPAPAAPAVGGPGGEKIARSYRAARSTLPAEHEAACAAYRVEWVDNFVKKIYERPANDHPSNPPLMARAGHNEAVHHRVRELGLTPDVCGVPTCFVVPHTNWWEPHCGYRIPDPTGDDLYAWVVWQDGLRPPDPEQMAMVRARELEANSRVRGCATCSTRPPG